MLNPYPTISIGYQAVTIHLPHPLCRIPKWISHQIWWHNRLFDLKLNMPTFDDLLSPHDQMFTTLAYWLGDLRSDAPRDGLSVVELRETMSCFYDMEDQNFAEEYREVDPFTDQYFSPIAPVTLTRRWCPIDSAVSWLGEPAWLELEASIGLRGIAAHWESVDPETLAAAVAATEDSAHFLFLLSLVVDRAHLRSSGVLLVCAPGWSFEYAQSNPMGSFGSSSFTAGRFYPERVPSGSIRIEQVADGNPH